jgi:hypothetical protein
MNDMNEKEFIERLKTENTDFPNERMARNLANSLESLSSDIFTEYIRFLFELIQNADDAEAVEVSIYLRNDYLIVSHSGKAFDQKDVEAICSIGEGTKIGERNKTGYKGIGFKSVFGKSNNVSIISQGFQFRFDSTFKHSKFPGTKMPWQIIPQWTVESDLLSNVSEYIQSKPFNVSTIIQLKETTSLEKDMIELLSNGEVLLFLRSVSKISITGNLSLTIEKTETKKTTTYTEINLQKNGNSISNWIVYSFDGIPIEENIRLELLNDEKTPIKLQNAKVAEISFAARIEKGKLKPLSGNESLVFTFLPTKVTSFQFPFLINSSFLTSANREEIHDDRIWNQWLMETAGKKFLDWLALLAATKEFSMQILQLLPHRTNLGNKLINKFFTSFFEYTTTKEFIPNRNLKLKKAPDILIDKTGLSDEPFIPTKILIEFINIKKDKLFKTDSLVHPNLELKHKLYELRSTAFDLDNLEEFFTHEIFKANHQPSENYALIKYFYEKVKKSEEKDAQEWNEKLKSISFIYAKGKKLKNPQSICFPSISYETEFGDGVTVMHSDVYSKIEADARIKQWLEKLGVKEPSDIAYIENEIIGNIENCITKDNYLQVTRYLFNQHKKALLHEMHYEGLRGLKLFTTNKQFEVAGNCYFSNTYIPHLNLEGVINNLHFLSSKYIESGDNYSEWKTFFLRIGVSENIEVETVESTVQIKSLLSRFESQYFDYIIAWAINEIPNEWNFGYHNSIHSVSKIKLIENATSNFEFCKLLWKNILSNKNLDIEILTKHPSHFKWHTYRPINYTEWFIQSKACFPSSTGKILKASELFINDKDIIQIAGKYMPVFVCDETLTEEWKKIIPFIPKLELDHHLTILSMISQEKKKDKELNESNKKRIGLIYNKIAAELSGYSNKKKEQIRIWASENELLSSNENFEAPSSLNWVNIPSFKSSSDKIKLLFVPENCDTKSKYFEELLTLFEVMIIDKFEISEETKEIAEENKSLKIQLQQSIPFLSLIIERKNLRNSEQEHKRLSKIIHDNQFFSSPEIILTFNNKGEKLQVSSLQAYYDKENRKVFFKGKWSSPITLFALVPELSLLLTLPDFTEELKLFLQLTPDEIKEWLTEQNFDVSQAPKASISEADIRGSEIETKSTTIESTSPEIAQLNKLLLLKNISYERLLRFIESIDADEDESTIGFSSGNHLEQKGKNEENRVARELVYQRLISEGFRYTNGMGENSVINGVFKDDIEYPLVVKSYRNTSYKFNIRPNEWLHLSKPNAMFWVHRGNERLEVLNLEGLLRANSEFHVQFETATFSFEGLVKFAEVFRFVKNVHFQLDAPNFSIAKAFEEYKFDQREKGVIEQGKDNQELLH